MVEPGFESKYFHLGALALIFPAEWSMHLWVGAELLRVLEGMKDYRSLSQQSAILLSSLPP